MAPTTRAAIRLLSLVLAILLFPGWVEVAENALHLVHDGHFAHSTQHDPEAAIDHPLGNHDEAPCSATDHHCQCCPSIPSVPPPEVASVSSALVGLASDAIIGFDGRIVSRSIPPPIRPPIS